MRPNHLLALLPFLLIGCATQVAGPIGEPELKLGEALRASLSALAPQSGSPNVIVADATVLSRARGDFGMVRRFTQHSESINASDGLKEELLTSEPAPKGTSSARALTRRVSLCGLVPLLTESTSHPAGDQVTVIQSGKAALPLFIGGGLRTGTRYLTNAADIDHLSPCNPKSVDSIVIRLRAQLLRRGTGPIGTVQRLQDVEETISCRIGPVGAKDLIPTQDGEVLQVDCKHESSIGFPVESKYAYVRAWQTYVPVHIIQAQGTDERFEYVSLSQLPK